MPRSESSRTGAVPILATQKEEKRQKKQENVERGRGLPDNSVCAATDGDDGRGVFGGDLKVVAEDVVLNVAAAVGWDGRKLLPAGRQGGGGGGGGVHHDSGRDGESVVTREGWNGEIGEGLLCRSVEKGLKHPPLIPHESQGKQIPVFCRGRGKRRRTEASADEEKARPDRSTSAIAAAVR